MGRVACWLTGLTVLLNAVVALAAPDDRSRTAACDFDAYHPLRFGTPIRGGHDQLAIKKVAPTYPPEAEQKGIRGRVSVQVLVSSSGDVVKACATGQPALTKAAEDAVLQWKFQKDFGLSYSGKPPAAPRYAVLTLSFDFQPTAPPPKSSCSDEAAAAKDTRGDPIWLSSDQLWHRVVHKTDLTFPMLDGHLHGDVTLDLLIGADGAVACATATHGNPIAIASAMDAIRTWRFQPFLQDNAPFAVHGRIVIHYAAGR